MNTLLSIGQFAKLCNTSKDTLIHYEELGLLSPEHIGKNHYRFYNVSQSRRFHTIRFLTQLNLPLPEIKELLDENATELLLQQLASKRTDLIQQKQYLESMMLHMDDLLQLHSLSPDDLASKPILFTQEFPQDFFITKPQTENPNAKQLMQTLEHHFLRCQKKGLYPYPISYIIKTTNLAVKNYTPAFIASPDNSGKTDNRSFRKPESGYVVISHKGSYSTIEQTIEKALTYIEENSFYMLGYSYISDLGDYFSPSTSSVYIIQISVKLP